MGVPSLALSVGGSHPVSADYQDKGESYSLTHTFRYFVRNGHSGPIQVTGLFVDSSNSISDEAENPTEENIPASLSVSGVTVEARSCDYTVFSGFNGGSGSESSPYLICTYAQLNKMRDNLTAYYELGQDINASPSWNDGDDNCTAYDGSTVPTTTPCTGWVPVGSSSHTFRGYLDGGDYIISNLYINISGSGTAIPHERNFWLQERIPRDSLKSIFVDITLQNWPELIQMALYHQCFGSRIRTSKFSRGIDWFG